MPGDCVSWILHEEYHVGPTWPQVSCRYCMHKVESTSVVEGGKLNG
jgi:hypothetical protein